MIVVVELEENSAISILQDGNFSSHIKKFHQGNLLEVGPTLVFQDKSSAIIRLY